MKPWRVFLDEVGRGGRGCCRVAPFSRESSSSAGVITACHESGQVSGGERGEMVSSSLSTLGTISTLHHSPTSRTTSPRRGRAARRSSDDVRGALCKRPPREEETGFLLAEGGGRIRAFRLLGGSLADERWLWRQSGDGRPRQGGRERKKFPLARQTCATCYTNTCRREDRGTEREPHICQGEKIALFRPWRCARLRGQMS